jgi:hypothetical protein
LSNPAQEKLLAGGELQGAVVQSLYEAIVKFRESQPTAGGTR